MARVRRLSVTDDGETRKIKRSRPTLYFRFFLCFFYLPSHPPSSPDQHGSFYLQSSKALPTPPSSQFYACFLAIIFLNVSLLIFKSLYFVKCIFCKNYISINNFQSHRRLKEFNLFLEKTLMMQRSNHTRCFLKWKSLSKMGMNLNGRKRPDG